jgi:DNA-binding FadR family transcriptional regulator
MISELYVMRQALEGTAARLAAQHASDVEIAALGALIEREAASLSDAETASVINKKIHRLIYSAAHNRYLLRSLSGLADTMMLLPTMLGDPSRAEQAHQEHITLLRAIESRDPVAAEEAARYHLHAAENSRLQWLMELEQLN